MFETLHGYIEVVSKVVTKKEEKSPMLPPARLMVLLHLRGGRSLYVILKCAS